MEIIIAAGMTFFGTQTIPGTLAAIVVFFGTLTALGVLIKKGWERYQTFRVKVSNVYASIVGDEAILDPQTGVVVVPARKPIGARVTIIEDALVSIAESLKRMTTIEETLAAILKRQEEHEKEAHDWVQEHNAHYDEEHARIWEAIEGKAFQNEPDRPLNERE